MKIPSGSHSSRQTTMVRVTDLMVVGPANPTPENPPDTRNDKNMKIVVVCSVSQDAGRNKNYIGKKSNSKYI